MSKIKIVSLGIFVFLSFGFKKSTVNGIYVKSISVNYVDLYITTVIAVDCDDFDRYFSEEKQSKIIVDSTQINKIVVYINSAKIVGKYSYQDVDTRIKFELKFNNDSIETICMGKFDFKRGNMLYNNNDSLITQLITVKK